MDSHGTTAPDGRRAGTPDPERALPAGRGQSGHAGDARHGHADRPTTPTTRPSSGTGSGGACCSRCRWWGSASMFADLLGYIADRRAPAGSRRCSARCVFLYGGWPFLTGAVGGARVPPARDDAADLDGDHGRVRAPAGRPRSASAASTWTSGGSSPLLVVIMLLGHWLEMRALGAGLRRARRAGRAAARRRPNGSADDGQVEPVALADLRRRRRRAGALRRPGARPTASVVDGEAEVDESMITGESRPVPAAPGDRVVAGTVATDSALRVRVDGRRRGHRAGRHPAARRPGAGVPLAGAGAGRPGRGAAVLLRHRRRR